MSKPVVSLCIPTNGVVEWVFPVLESIYNQKCDIDLFEVVITDNGSNIEFKNKIRRYLKDHSNIIYAETDALPFINEIECYKRANGDLIKFVNHRTLLVDGALSRIIEFAENNKDNKPIVYFSNGVLDHLNDGLNTFDSFDCFVKNLSYWSSWSTGMTIWKSDFEKLPEDVSSFNELFPHTNVLFNERNREKYIIDNTIIFDEMPQGKKPKGNYDLFGAFGIEYPGIICDLLRAGSISKNTYLYITRNNLVFVAQQYLKYCVRKDYCSYDLSGFNYIFDVYYSKMDFAKAIGKFIVNKLITNNRNR